MEDGSPAVILRAPFGGSIAAFLVSKNGRWHILVDDTLTQSQQEKALVLATRRAKAGMPGAVSMDAVLETA